MSLRSGVAICGKAAAGKNAFARWLSEELILRGHWPYEMAFSDEMKLELLEGEHLTKESPGYRERLLEIGKARRDADRNYWVKRFNLRVDHVLSYGLIPLITDVRMMNELCWAEECGMVTVRIDALRIDRAVALAARGEESAFADSEHETEVALDEEKFDVRFWNPHGTETILRRYAFFVADLLDGTLVRQPALPSSFSPVSLPRAGVSRWGRLRNEPLVPSQDFGH